MWARLPEKNLMMMMMMMMMMMIIQNILKKYQIVLSVFRRRLYSISSSVDNRT